MYYRTIDKKTELIDFPTARKVLGIGREEARWICRTKIQPIKIGRCQLLTRDQVEILREHITAKRGNDQQ